MLKLHAGVSRKVGLPGFSSASASCHIEAELDSSLLQDQAGFQIVVQRAYESCEKAVQAQIAKFSADEPTPSEPQPACKEVVEVRTSPAIQGATVTTNTAVLRDKPSPRPATASQVRAIRAICSRRRINLPAMLQERFGIETADDLGIRQASNLIDELKGDSEPSPSNGSANGTGTSSYAVTGGAR